MLLDVSSHADQMGVTLGPALRVGRDRGGAKLQANASSPVAIAGSGLPLQIMTMDVVTTAQTRAPAILPQISWEPLLNIPLEIEGRPGPADRVTVSPGLFVYADDGFRRASSPRVPTRSRSRRCP